MTNTATGTFDIDAWDGQEPSEDADGTSMTRAHVKKTFHGGMSGTSTTEIITVTTASGPAAYVGVERFEGALEGRKGAFVLQHSAGSEDGTAEGQWLRWLIVPTSGTGDLAGIRGEGRIIITKDGGHSYELDYELA